MLNTKQVLILREISNPLYLREKFPQFFSNFCNPGLRIFARLNKHDLNGHNFKYYYKEYYLNGHTLNDGFKKNEIIMLPILILIMINIILIIVTMNKFLIHTITMNIICQMR